MINLLCVDYNGMTNVENNFQTYFKLLTNKSINLFKWENLPESVDERFLMENLILQGKVCFTKFNDKLYALNGNFGGEPNACYEPTKWIVANPILGSKTIKVRQKDGSRSLEGLEGIVVSLTQLDQDLQNGIHGGLYGLIYQTAGLLADNISSLNCAQINSRAALVVTADSEALANGAEEVLKDIYGGKPYKVLSQDIINKIGITPLAASGSQTLIINLIEARRSILQDFYAELGIGYNGNMKRERINTAETKLMTDSLNIGIWQMEKSLKDGIEEVNRLFGTDIQVRINEEVISSTEEELATEEDINSDNPNNSSAAATEIKEQESESSKEEEKDGDLNKEEKEKEEQ